MLSRCFLINYPLSFIATEKEIPNNYVSLYSSSAAYFHSEARLDEIVNGGVFVTRTQTTDFRCEVQTIKPFAAANSADSVFDFNVGLMRFLFFIITTVERF